MVVAVASIRTGAPEGRPERSPWECQKSAWFFSDESAICTAARTPGLKIGSTRWKQVEREKT